MSLCDSTMHVLSVYRRLETRLHAMVGICSVKSVYTLTFVSGWVLLESHGIIYFKGALSQTEERYQETESQVRCAEERGGGGRATCQNRG